MERTEVVVAPCGPDRLFALVEDLGGYPDWLGIVAGAEPAAPEPGDGGPAWSVELRGRLGPLARSKRLRMVRREHHPPERVVFERRERGDRPRSAWVLTATVAEEGDGSELTVHLHYGGSLWGPVVERLLGEEIEHARPRLVGLVSD